MLRLQAIPSIISENPPGLMIQAEVNPPQAPDVCFDCVYCLKLMLHNDEIFQEICAKLEELQLGPNTRFNQPELTAQIHKAMQDAQVDKLNSVLGLALYDQE